MGYRVWGAADIGRNSSADLELEGRGAEDLVSELLGFWGILLGQSMLRHGLPHNVEVKGLEGNPYNQIEQP